jgi:HEAT repeat protein
MEQTGFGQPRSGSRTGEDDIEPLLTLAGSDDPLKRRVAIKNLCTCHVQADDDRAWAALLRAFDDGDIRVRREALHALTDSAPATRVPDVVRALERRYEDPDSSLRRRIRRTLLHFRRTGHLTDAPK